MKPDRDQPVNTAHPRAVLSHHDRAIGTEVPAVVLEDVSLAFDDNVVLRGVSLRFAPGT